MHRVAGIFIDGGMSETAVCGARPPCGVWVLRERRPWHRLCAICFPFDDAMRLAG